MLWFGGRDASYAYVPLLSLGDLDEALYYEKLHRALCIVKGALMADLKARLWKFVTYRDSMPDDWEEIADEIGVPMFVSPWHDRDVDEDGKLKKPHRHWLMEFDGPVTYSQALSLVTCLGVSIVKKCASKRRDERYWIHLNSPTKAQYDLADCICFGGYEPKYLGEQEEWDGISAIHQLCEELGIVYYCDLANEVVEHYPEYLTCLLRYPAHFNNFCYSRERMASRDNLSYVKSRRRMGRYEV